MSTSAEPELRVLASAGFAILPACYETVDRAWAAALRMIDAAATVDELCRGMPHLQVVAQYTMPTADAPGRDFQPLHLDFGIPLSVADRLDVARYTALYVDTQVAPSGAAIRIVRLAGLREQRTWPPVDVLSERLRVRHDDPDRAEGVLARIVEGADDTAELPSKAGSGFACGLEFESAEDEVDYFARHRIDVSRIEHRVVLRPGEVLVLDNLACAHGRMGRRSVGELHQLCVGFAGLDRSGQRAVLEFSLRELTTLPGSA